MNESGTPLGKPTSVVFRDALGERCRVIDSNGKEAELLCFSADLSSLPGFDTALRKNVARLASFHHPSFADLHGVERLNPTTLAVASDIVQGVRLSEILAVAVEKRVVFDRAAAMYIMRQLVPAIAALHESDAGVAHGALGPERIALTPHAQVIVTDHALAPALEQLRYSQLTYWRSLRIALPRSNALLRFEPRADLTQMGAVALALALGRLLKDDEHSAKLVDVAAMLDPSPLRDWLSYALQIDPRRSFASAAEAAAELEMIEGDRAVERASLERHLAQHHGILRPAPTLVAPPPAPASVLMPVLVDTPTEVPVYAMPPAPPPLVVATQIPATWGAPPPATRNDRRESSSKWMRIATAAVVLLMFSTGAAFALRWRASASSAAAETGTLAVQSSPSGARVDIDGKPSGVTPAKFTLREGAHTLVLRGVGDPRTMSIVISSGAQISQYIELTAGRATSGGLIVRTDPPGAQVSVDRVLRGPAPVTVTSLEPGDHWVIVSADGASVEHQVTIEAGITSALVVPMIARDRSTLSGWISLSAPIDVQIFENGRLLGTNQTDRIMVQAGEHHLDFVNDSLGYRATRSVSVAPGKVESISVKLPSGSIAVNAIPWAEVWLDGEKAGDTPIGNLQTAIGRHDVVFRHPELGEVRQVVTVSANTPSRLSADMRKK